MALNIKKFNLFIAFGILAVLVIAVLGIRILSANKTPISEDELVPTPEVIPTIDDSVMIDLDFVSGGKAMVLTIDKIPPGTDTIDYEITYTTGEGIPKGNIGSIKVEGKEKVTRSGEELTLGTCSRGRCVYYEGVKSVTLSLKFKNNDGKTSTYKKDFELL